jgi:hypothetical protein
MKKSLLIFVLTLNYVISAEGFFSKEINPRLQNVGLLAKSKGDGPEFTSYSRREACQLSISGLITTGSLFLPDEANAADGYRPARRPTAYRVDSTQPPTLIPLSNVRKEASMLADLGKGFGTDKQVIVDDRVNLNNILNKAVFGTIDTFSGLTGTKKEEKKSGLGYSSFVCIGVPAVANSNDIDLTLSLIGPILKERKADTAIGLSFCPLSTQSDLDNYSKSGNESVLIDVLRERGVTEDEVTLYLPLIRYARSISVKLLALSPEKIDVLTARTKGLQNLNVERRKSYVIDAEGFIAMSADPRFRMYTDRSLLKDFSPIDAEDKPGDFFAERILVHETAATVAATYTAQRPDSLVAIVAPTPDLRFLLGINGRIPRICKYLNGDDNHVTNDVVTTILLNPTSKETLSKSRFLRLEIGTGPDTLDYQAKVADYLWFSSSPKVNLIPRLMNA